MRKIHIVFTQDQQGRVTIEGAFTNKTRAWQVFDELTRKGHIATYESVEINPSTSTDILLNVWTYI